MLSKVATIILLTTASASAAPLCGATKLAIVKKSARAELECHRRAAEAGGAVDPACLATADGALTVALLAIDARGGCDLTAPGEAVSTSLIAFVTDVAGVLRPGTTPSSCAATKIGATATATMRRIACHKQAESRGTDVTARCVAGADEKLQRIFTGADATGTCAPVRDAAAIAALVDEWLESMAGFLRPVRRVSVSSHGREGRRPSVEDRISSVKPALSADGRVVAFNSNVEDLVDGDANGHDVFDVLAHDVVFGTTELVTVATDGTQTNADPPGFAVVSGDGRFVAFDNRGVGLVPGDTNEASDVFVRDRVLHTTERVSVDTDEVQSQSPFSTSSGAPAISGDGRFVAFESYAWNLVPDDTNSRKDVFVRDRSLGTTERVSLGAGGVEANRDCNNPTLSADGRWVTFLSAADNLVVGDTPDTDDFLLVDRTTGDVELVSATWDGSPNDAPAGGGPYSAAAISGDAHFVAFSHPAGNIVPGDSNGLSDIFVRDRLLGTTQRISVGLGGAEADGQSVFPNLSADGRFIAFESAATNLVPDDDNGVADIFVLDRQTGEMVLLSRASDGSAANGFSSKPSMSADGRRVAFYSKASNLVRNDRNAVVGGLDVIGFDVFVRSLDWP